MDPARNAAAYANERAECVRRLRQQVVTGAYEPPIDLLVERLVSLLVGEPSAPTVRPRPNRRAHPAQ